MILKIWDNGGKTADRYLVRIRNDYYAMDDRPGMPNGICIYLGENVSEKGQGDRVHQSALPEGVRKKIAELS